MELVMPFNKVKKLAFYGPSSRYIYLFNNNKPDGSLYNQKPELFSINLLSSLKILKPKFSFIEKAI